MCIGMCIALMFICIGILISLSVFSVEVVLRAEAVESAQAGDKCDFTGTLIVVPDVAAINLPGSKAETRSAKNRGGLSSMFY